MKATDVTPKNDRKFQLELNEEEMQILYSLLAASYSGLFDPMNPALLLHDMYRDMYREMGEVLGKPAKYELIIKQA